MNKITGILYLRSLAVKISLTGSNSQQIVRHLCNHFSVARLRSTLTEGKDTSNTSTPNQIVNHSVKSDQHTN